MGHRQDGGADRRLAGRPVTVAMPGDRPGSASRRPTVRPVPTPPRAAALTPPDRAVPVVVAALAVLVYRYTGSSDVVLGHAGRRFGAVRLRVDGSTPVPDLVAAVAQALAGADAATAGGVAEPGPVAAGAGGAVDPPYHAVVTRPGARGSDELTYADLVVVLDDRPGPPRLALVANAERFSTGLADRLARHLGVLLDSCAAALDGGPAARSRVDDLDLLAEDEQRRVLRDWPRTAATAPRGYVHELVARVARDAPDAPAVVHRGVTTSFGALDRDANRLAHHLLERGAGAGSTVAVFLERGAESLAAVLAVFKAGAAAVLLDPADEHRTVASLLAATSPAALVTTGRLAPLLSAPPHTLGGTPTMLDADAAAWRSAEPTDPGRTVHAGTPSHLVSTAGTTGPRRIVAVTHGALRAAVDAVGPEWGVDRDSRGLWLCGPGSRLVALECLAVLAAGGAVYVPDPQVALAPERHLGWLHGHRIGHLVVSPATAGRLWEQDWPASTPLRSMAVTGGPVPGWPPPGLPFTVSHVYASAEAVIATMCDLGAVAARLSTGQRVMHRPPIGRPVPNAAAYVLDRRRRPVPPGVVGELHVGGATLAAGYVRDAPGDPVPFTVPPVEGDPHPAPVHGTGDAAVYWEDGTIEVIGRAGGPAYPRPAARQAVPAVPRRRHVPFPLTARQRARAYATGAGSGALDGSDHVDSYRWTGAGLDVARLCRAWRRLVERHDALRTVVRPDGTQVVLPRGRWPEPVVVDPGAPPEEPAAGPGRRPAASPEFQIMTLPGDEVRVTLRLNRLLVDPDSAHRLLFAELDALYAGDRPAPPPAVTFRDYAVSALGRWAEQDLAPPHRAAGVDAGRRPVPEPAGPGVDRAPLAGAAGTPASRRFDLDAATWAALERGAADSAAEPAGVLLAALADAVAAVARRAGSPIVLRRQVFPRPPVHPDIAAVAGCFTAVVPVPGRSGDVSFGERARALSEQPADGSDSARLEDPGEAGTTVLATVLVGPAGETGAGAGLRYPDEVVSPDPRADADVRAVRAGAGVRVHWTFRAGGPAGLAAVADAYAAELARRVRDRRDWWLTAGTSARQRDRLGPPRPGAAQ